MPKPPENAPKKLVPMPKNGVKTVQFAIGVDLIGSKQSMQASRNNILEATAIGIKMTSRGTGRVVVIPYSNVKGFELYPDMPEAEDGKE